jgi:hypothetical protein
MMSLIGAIKYRRLRHQGFRDYCRKLPIADMRAKAKHRFVILDHAAVAIRHLRRVGDDVGSLSAGAFQGEFVEVGKLDGDPSEIVPYTGEDLLDLGGALGRIGGAQIFASDIVLRQQRPNLAHECAGEIGATLAVDMFDRAQQSGGKCAARRVENLGTRLH